MSYKDALEAAGATVLAFETFGSYQGDWWARVIVKGRKGFIGGSYGSCSGCDALEAEFPCSDDACNDEHFSYDPKCSKCIEAKKDWSRRFAEFGAQYLADIMSRRAAIKKASENLRWDGDAQNMVDWIKAQK